MFTYYSFTVVQLCLLTLRFLVKCIEQYKQFKAFKDVKDCACVIYSPRMSQKFQKWIEPNGGNVSNSIPWLLLGEISEISQPVGVRF